MANRLALSALLLAAACGHPANLDPPASNSLAERFELVAFYDEISGDELPLQRWGVPVQVFLGGYDARPYRDQARAVLADLDQLTPMPVRLAPDGDGATMIVLIGTWEEIDEFRADLPNDLRGRARRFTCYAQAFIGNRSPPGVLAGGWVLIDSSSDPEVIRRCIAQEITQVLGLPNDIDDPEGTVFSSNSRRDTLSDSDRDIVRILYDPRLRPGMSRAEAMPIVRQIAAELEAEQSAGR